MVKNFNWHRESFSAKDYAEKMGIAEEERVKKSYVASDSSKQKRAYDVAADIRKFEIDKYWQRTLYFWGFITAIYAAYFSVLKEFYTDVLGFRSHGTIPLVVLSALGLFFCFSWLLASKGSKHWQENWENHLDMLEDEITGPLYKTYLAGTSYSVSAINIAAGIVLSLCAYGLFMFECIKFTELTLDMHGASAMGICAVFMVFVAVALFVYMEHVTGNSKNEGTIQFHLKQYEEIIPDESGK